MSFIRDDGGRAAAGYSGMTGDCACRAVSIASGKPYQEVYDALAGGRASQRQTKHRTNAPRRSAAHGINVKRKWFRDYMISLGFTWHPTMQIGSGCKVHLCAEELPAGRLVVAVSKHYTAMIDGVIHDTYDPRRDTHCIDPDHGQALRAGQWRNENGVCSIQRRCVYGYWQAA